MLTLLLPHDDALPSGFRLKVGFVLTNPPSVCYRIGITAPRPRELLNEAIEAVKKVVGENGWFAVDRGMDSVEFIFFKKRRDFLGVVRVNKMDCDMFGTGRMIDKDFAKVRFVKAELQTYRGTVTARVKWKPGVFTDECGNQTKVLVVESRVGGRPIWLYVTCPDSAFEDEAEMQRLAILAYPPPKAPEGIARWGARVVSAAGVLLSRGEIL